jgi:hypothetical protein
MTDQPNSVPAGWYPDPNGAPTQRWWDGTSWTEHYAPPAGVVAVRPQIAADARVDGVWIWLIAALPLLSIATFFAFDFRGYMAATMTGDFRGMLSAFGIGYALVALLSWAAWGAVVFFAYRDWRDLKNAGVVRPFHWAWAFLAGLVYLIGRTVILRKVSTKGLGPLWAGIAVYVIVLIASIVWSIWITAEVMGSIYDYLPSGGYGYPSDY